MQDAEKVETLKELRDLMVYLAAMMQSLEAVEHRVATVVEQSRMQMGHLVGDLKIREMQYELHQIHATMMRIEKKLA